MNHPDLEYEILLSMAEERIRGKRVVGLREPRMTGNWRLRLMEQSGDKLVSLGYWLIARSDKQSFAPGAPKQVPAQ